MTPFALAPRGARQVRIRKHGLLGAIAPMCLGNSTQPHLATSHNLPRSLHQSPARTSMLYKAATPLPGWHPASEPVFGAHVLRFSKMHKIVQPSRLKPARVRFPKTIGNETRISVQAGPEHAFDEKHFKYLDKDEHPFCQTLLDKYLEKKQKQSLWVRAFVPPSAGTIFVCREAERRLKHAFATALGFRGYDRYGWRADPAGTRPTYVDARGELVVSSYPKLVGTVRLKADEPKAIFQTDFNKLVAQMDVVVQTVEAQLGVQAMGRNEPMMSHRQTQRSPPRYITQQSRDFPPARVAPQQFGTTRQDSPREQQPPGEQQQFILHPRKGGRGYIVQEQTQQQFVTTRREYPREQNPRNRQFNFQPREGQRRDDSVRRDNSQPKQGSQPKISRQETKTPARTSSDKNPQQRDFERYMAKLKARHGGTDETGDDSFSSNFAPAKGPGNDGSPGGRSGHWKASF